MKQEQVNRLAEMLVILILTLLLLLAAEFSLRLIFPGKFSGAEEKELLFKYNDDYLLEPLPGSSGTYVRQSINGGDSINWQINQDGFRGKALKENPEFRVMVYGDSNIQARFSRNENTFAARLEKYLGDSSGKETEVINAGVIGFGPDQSLIKMKSEFEDYRPDLILFHVFADNDYGDIFRNMLLKLDERGSLEDTGVRVRSEELDTGRKSFFSSLALVRATAKIAKKLRKTPGAEDWAETYLEWNRAEFEAYRDLDPDVPASGDDYDIDLATMSDPEAAALKFRLMEAILLEAAGFAAERGAGFLVLAQPSVIDLAQGNSVLDYKWLASRYPDYDRMRLSSGIEDICSRHEIPCLNFFPIFLESQAETLYFRFLNNHWNDRGQDLAARTTAKTILDYPGLRLCSEEIP